jgi:bifunctional polynucleotide phosphatase/kinase
LSKTDENRVPLKVLQARVDGILAELNLPIDFICANSEHSVYRKPGPGMWQFLFSKRCPQGVLAESFFVGDAAGRPKSGDRKKDFASSDFAMALNVGCTFYTPECFFNYSDFPLHRELPTPFQRSRLVRLVKNHNLDNAEAVYRYMDFCRERCQGRVPEPGGEIVLLVAPAACGKSTLARLFPPEHYQRVCQDELQGRFELCEERARKFLVEGRSVVIDNTNIGSKRRSDWVRIANECGKAINCIVIETPKDIAVALAKMRVLSPLTAPEDHRVIESQVIHAHFNDLEPVLDNEGFKAVERVKWAPRATTDTLLQYMNDCYLPLTVRQLGKEGQVIEDYVSGVEVL